MTKFSHHNAGFLGLLGASLLFSLIACSSSSEDTPDTPNPIVPPTTQQYDWSEFPVPAQAGDGMKWELQAQSDEFNYDAPADNKGATFLSKWSEGYHNGWLGPGPTKWTDNHTMVEEGEFRIIASREQSSGKTLLGCIHSNTQVIYPVFVEARAKVMNSVLASDVWMLSSDDTQEIDILEAYGSDREDQTWFAERLHLSYHLFIRNPFQDYQPTDATTWYYENGKKWRDDFVRIGVYWKNPTHLEYYVNGKLVKTVTGSVEDIDPKGYTNGTGINKPMDIIINTEDQDWRAKKGWTPTDEELANKENNTFRVDWIRVYKPVAE